MTLANPLACCSSSASSALEGETSALPCHGDIFLSEGSSDSLSSEEFPESSAGWTLVG